jgi:ATPase subunit of ABC transporter with duplicated ATPase domains
MGWIIDESDLNDFLENCTKTVLELDEDATEIRYFGEYAEFDDQYTKAKSKIKYPAVIFAEYAGQINDAGDSALDAQVVSIMVIAQMTRGKYAENRELRKECKELGLKIAEQFHKEAERLSNGDESKIAIFKPNTATYERIEMKGDYHEGYKVEFAFANPRGFNPEEN